LELTLDFVFSSQNHLNLVVANNVPLFFNVRDGPYMPTLRLLHQYPDIMKKFQVDRGAIKFVLAGANIMCPGLTSPGGGLDDDVLEARPVNPKDSGQEIEAIQARFFWNGCVDTSGGWHDISWGRVRRSKEAGVVGIRNIRDFNLALFCKWIWWLGTEDDGLWIQLIS
ncbi:hypothetical protein Taro_039179, partial [Colocasia esculenta]|nr:hypothetical protein [Colocasia esculenta]